MKIRTLRLSGLLVVSLCLFSSWLSADPAPEAPAKVRVASANRVRWEYQVVHGRQLADDREWTVERFLNQQGEDGWELISVAVYPLGEKSYSRYTFKRPKVD